MQRTYDGALTVDHSDWTATSSGRTSDSPPWYGGDLINRSGNLCTSWFSSYSGSQAYNLTAGHCGRGTWKNGTTTQGTTASLSLSFGGFVDAQTFKVSSNSGVVFSDPSSNVVRSVTSISSTQTVGTLVCTDGSSDREVCAVRIDQYPVSISYDGNYLINQVQASQNSRRNAFSAGDSGGPVYSISSSGVARAYGMIVARKLSDPSYGWYTPVINVENYMHVTVKT